MLAQVLYAELKRAGLTDEAMDSRQKELATQCLRTCLSFEMAEDLRVRALQLLAAYPLEDKFLRFVIKSDNATALALLMKFQRYSWNTRLTPVQSNAMHQGPSQPLIEVIFQEKARQCLAHVLKNSEVCFLSLTSDGRPLASLVFELELTNPMRVHAMQTYSEFSSSEFYQDALIALNERPRYRPNADVAYLMHQRAFHAPRPDANTSHFEQKVATLNAIQVLVSDIGAEVQRAVSRDKRFRNYLSNAAPQFYKDLSKLLKDGTGHLQSLRKIEFETATTKLMKDLYHMREFLHFSLPQDEEGEDAIRLQGLQQSELRLHYYKCLRDDGVLKSNPFNGTTVVPQYGLANDMHEGSLGTEHLVVARV